MSDGDPPPDFSETNTIILASTVISAIIAGIGWCCRHRCRNMACDVDSGCCKFHSDSRLRQTIREEIRREMSQGDLESPVEATD